MGRVAGNVDTNGEAAQRRRVGNGESSAMGAERLETPVNVLGAGRGTPGTVSSFKSKEESSRLWKRQMTQPTISTMFRPQMNRERSPEL